MEGERGRVERERTREVVKSKRYDSAVIYQCYLLTHAVSSISSTELRAFISCPS
jgi:hypothetical protein